MIVYYYSSTPAHHAWPQLTAVRCAGHRGRRARASQKLSAAHVCDAPHGNHEGDSMGDNTKEQERDTGRATERARVNACMFPLCEKQGRIK